MGVRTSLSYQATSSWKRLDFFLKDRGISRKLITSLKYIGCLQVNGSPATTIHPVSAGDIVTLLFPPENTLSCAPEEGSFSILYEDDDILVIDKPYGIATHPAPGTKGGTLGNFVSGYYQTCGCPISFRPVSRLDKTTSGVIVIAKHAFSHHRLSAQQTDGTFQKTYLALVEGIPAPPEGTIRFPIIRETPTSLKRICHPEGKPAHTDYRVLSHRETKALVELQLKTGRTHQIRVHMSQIGHPLTGDLLYGGSPWERLCLHSWRTGFVHPVTNQPMTFTAPCEF